VSPGGAAPAGVHGGGGVRWSNCGRPLPTHVGEAVRGGPAAAGPCRRDGVRYGAGDCGFFVNFRQMCYMILV
jgi:hypothetical protein